MDAFIAKFSGETRKDLGDIHGVLWEHDNDIPLCRQCFSKFSLVLRKHHCRGCGSIYCENCLKSKVNLSSNGNNNSINEILDWACQGCIDAKTPGEQIKQIIENKLNSIAKSSTTRIMPLPIELIKGSKFENIVLEVSKVSSFIPKEGYFEFYNKTDNATCALKLLTSGSDVYWETPRPTYILVPPQHVVHAEFDPTLSGLDMILILNYPVQLLETANHLNKDYSSIKINKFQDVIIYKINSKNKNVLLKYKGEGLVEIRKGGSFKLPSFLKFFKTSLTKKNAASSKAFDFSTNIIKIEKVYDSQTANNSSTIRSF